MRPMSPEAESDSNVCDALFPRLGAKITDVHRLAVLQAGHRHYTESFVQKYIL